MFNISHGSKIGVESTDTDGSYIIVPTHQAAALCRLLAEHCIPHAVEAQVPSHHHAEAPA